ncbi:hypothetical protein P1X14_05120 [Sphingomonas sp. AOB5]|uniref:hypothetical protein n=1 Tax=Sphingomonas sp. AOB5 TaxID=3034017 RepID=UPI0023F91152|nr:hypothetical protein [Sphingomonas sp. AOB5]MDF7774619.1 hypothetical protein [Sphingomonas sp. AOB5]
MTFREKILLSSMAITLVIWGWYFTGFIGALKAGRIDQGEATGDFVLAVIVLTVIHIVMATLVAIFSPKSANAPADDREKAYAIAAYRPAYFILSAAVVTTMLAGPVLLRIAGEMKLDPELAPVVLGNAMLAALVLAELVHSGFQLVRFRIGG